MEPLIAGLRPQVPQLMILLGKAVVLIDSSFTKFIPLCLHSTQKLRPPLSRLPHRAFILLPLISLSQWQTVSFQLGFTVICHHLTLPKLACQLSSSRVRSSRSIRGRHVLLLIQHANSIPDLNLDEKAWKTSKETALSARILHAGCRGILRHWVCDADRDATFGRSLFPLSTMTML